MSLEETMTRLATAVEKNNELQSALLGKIEAKTGGAPAAAASDAGEGEADKPRRGRKPNAEKAAETAKASGGDSFEIGFADMKKNLTAWLGEFAKPGDKDNPDAAHPEVKARRTELKTVFGKLGVAKLDEIKDDAAKLAKLNKWLESKAKVTDHVGAGVGRFAVDPVEDDGDLDDTSVDNDDDL